MDHAALHQRAREKGANRIVYWIVRAVLQPFFHVYFRMTRVGLEHVPQDGPVIIAANHRSFLDPFVIGRTTLSSPAAKAQSVVSANMTGMLDSETRRRS